MNNDYYKVKIRMYYCCQIPSWQCHSRQINSKALRLVWAKLEKFVSDRKPEFIQINSSLRISLMNSELRMQLRGVGCHRPIIVLFRGTVSSKTDQAIYN